jgi:hypothetical protein
MVAVMSGDGTEHDRNGDTLRLCECVVELGPELKLRHQALLIDRVRGLLGHRRLLYRRVSLTGRVAATGVGQRRQKD